MEFKIANEIKIKNLAELQKNELIKNADNCYIHRLLKGEWNIEQAQLSLNKLLLN